MTDSPLLVFGDDGSPSADRAWGWVTGQQWPSWRIQLVTVESPPLPKPHDVDEPVPALRPFAPAQPRSPGVDLGTASIENLVAEGDPRAVLGGCTDADLLVIGPRGKGVLDRLLIGSVASALLSAPPAPLLVARRAGPVRRVLVCADGSADAAGAVEALAGLPLVTTASITVLCVDDDRTPVDEALAAAVGPLREAGATVTTQRERGMVPGIVLRVIDEHDVDLVVMGTAGRTGLARMWLGSTASAVAHAAPCSVLVARSPDRA